MQRSLGRGLRLAALLAAAICLYTGLLLAAYSFPDEWISDNVGAASMCLQKKATWWGGVMPTTFGIQVSASRTT